MNRLPRTPRIVPAPLLSLLLLVLPPATPAAARQEGPQTASRLEGLPVASITIEGLTNLDEDVVRRRLDLRVGEPFHAVTARRDERAVSALALFWSVRIQAEGVPAGAQPRSVAVRVVAEERFGWLALPQFYWTEQEGWSYGAVAGHMNVAGRGHRFFLTAYTGGRRLLSLSLSNPWNGIRHESFHIGGAVVRARNLLYGFKERGERLTAEAGRWFGRSGRGRIGFRYQRVRSDRPNITRSAPFEDRLHMVWAMLGVDTTDPWAYPRLGWVASLTMEGNGGILGGDLNGSAIGALATVHAPIGPSLVLAARGVAEARYGDLPFWRLLTVGGPNTIRGYPLGYYLVRRRWDVATELQWYALPMRAYSLGALGEQLLGISFSIFVDLGAGGGVARGPAPGPWQEQTPLLTSWGAGASFHNAALGVIRLEIAWPDRGRRRITLRLGRKL